MSNEEVNEVKVGVTWDKFIDVVKGTWHLALLMFALVWSIASYKSGLDTHLQTIDQQLQKEDNKLNWLINHHADVDQMPPGDIPSYVPQTKKIKPQSYMRDWRLAAAEEQAPQDAKIPPLTR